MSLSKAFRNQIENRNFLSPIGFRFVLNRAPKVAFFGNNANIPGMTLGVAIQPTYLKDIDIPGDKIQFNDLSIRFLVDEDLENYMEIQNWIRGIGFPESLKEIYDWQNNNSELDITERSQLQMNLYSDATLTVLTSSNNSNFKVKFFNLFPYSLTDLQFDATGSDVDYLTAEATFKYTIYNIVDNKNNKL